MLQRLWRALYARVLAKPWGFGVQLGGAERGLWSMSDWSHDDPREPGEPSRTEMRPPVALTLKLRAGMVYRPLGPWPGHTRAIKFPCPLPILPYIAIEAFSKGAYLGFKDFDSREALGGPAGEVWLAPSMTWRTRAP
ncbi:MAG: hypothetical protein AB1830_13065 [Pseudomonadota bacterium]